MIQLHVVNSVPYEFLWVSKLLDWVKYIFVDVHRCKILSDLAIVWVRKLALLFVDIDMLLEEVVDVDAVDSLAHLLTWKGTAVLQFFACQESLAADVSVRIMVLDFHPGVWKNFWDGQSILRSHLQKAADEVFRLGTQHLFHALRETEAALVDQSVQVLHVLSFERNGAAEHRVQQNSQTP